MDTAIDIFKAFISLYVDVFKKYPLAASITTLLFVIGYQNCKILGVCVHCQVRCR